MSENNNQPRMLSDVALERVMRDVLNGVWELAMYPADGQAENSAVTQEPPDEGTDTAR